MTPVIPPPFHQVYVRWDDRVWLGVARYAQLREVRQGLPMVTLNVERRGPVCLSLPDRVLCDHGPNHDHEPPQVLER